MIPTTVINLDTHEMRSATQQRATAHQNVVAATGGLAGSIGEVGHAVDVIADPVVKDLVVVMGPAVVGRLVGELSHAVGGEGSAFDYPSADGVFGGRNRAGLRGLLETLWPSTRTIS